MNNAVSCVIGFVAGAAIGSLASYFIVKTKFDKILSEERIAMKESFDSIIKKQKESKEEVKEEPKEDMEEKKKDGPYIITPEEFGEFEQYRQQTLYYYSDGIVTDVEDNRIRDIEKLIGDYDLGKLLEKEEDDCVYIRNEKLLREYEIMLDERNYKDLD